MARKILIAGNWKMYKTAEDSVRFVKALQSNLKGTLCDVVVCPPFTSLVPVRAALAGGVIGLGAQNLHWQDEGAFTGEVSPKMLKAAGCAYVIIGHSERRSYFSETNAVIRQKLDAALRHGLFPILCIGERLEERERNRTFDVLSDHLSVFQGLDRKQAESVVIAYEPVWAIGTGRNATPAQAEEVHLFIRKRFKEFYGEDFSKVIRILYGGSVKPDNIASLLLEPDIDGALVGGASLDEESFLKIVAAALERMKVRLS
ncbi:MAG: triose-phosphate isomerase [Candidatus Omnitrophota bacterium]